MPKKVILLMILNEGKKSCSRKINKLIFIVWIVFILLKQKTRLNQIIKYVRKKIFVMYLYLLNTLKYQNLTKLKNPVKQHILFKQVWNVFYQRLMHVRTILKIHLHCCKRKYFIKFLEYLRLEAQKLSKMYTEVKIVWKCFVNT